MKIGARRALADSRYALQFKEFAFGVLIGFADARHWSSYFFACRPVLPALT